MDLLSAFRSVQIYLDEDIFNKINITFLLLTFFFSVTTVFADSRDVAEFDGNEWNLMNETLKIGYIKGFLAGSIYVIEGNMKTDSYGSRVRKNKDKAANFYYRVLGASDTLSNAFSSSDCKWVVGYEIYVTNERLYRYSVYGITVGQIVDGLDELYKDFKNKSINVQDAIYVIKKQIKGTPEEEVKQILLYLRSGKKNLDALWTRDKKGKRKNFISFP